jgi:hypothetical protein
VTQSPDELLGQLRGVTGPLPAPPAEGWPAWVWLIPLAFVIAIAFSFRARRRRRPPAPSPSDEALAALTSLPADPNPESLTAIARRYLTRTHSVPADRLTTAELLADLPAEVATAWSSIFADIDKARFSGRPLRPDEWTALVATVRALIQADGGNPAGPGDREN